MMSYPPPASNLERQRQFRERNPGYYGRLKAKRREKLQAFAEQRAAEEALAMVVQREPLMLPAPVETIEIPGMNMIPLSNSIPAPIPVPVRRSSSSIT